MSVVALKTKPSQAAIDAARDLLAKCESGEVIAVIAAGQHVGGAVTTYLRGNYDRSRVVFALECMKHEIVDRALYHDAEPVETGGGDSSG